MNQSWRSLGGSQSAQRSISTIPAPTQPVSELRPFTHIPDCPKCGGGHFHWKYVPTGYHLEGLGICPVGYGDEGEHLDLTCTTCGYELGMRTKDDHGDK